MNAYTDIYTDACPIMIKIIRNTLGDKKVLINNEGNTIISIP